MDDRVMRKLLAGIAFLFLSATASAQTLRFFSSRCAPSSSMPNELTNNIGFWCPSTGGFANQVLLHLSNGSDGAPGFTNLANTWTNTQTVTGSPSFSSGSSGMTFSNSVSGPSTAYTFTGGSGGTVFSITDSTHTLSLVPFNINSAAAIHTGSSSVPLEFHLGGLLSNPTWSLSTAGDFIPYTDGSSNVGTSSNRVKNFYAGNNSVLQSNTAGMIMSNTATAGVGAAGQQWSPGLQLTGRQHNGSTSVAVDWMLQERPISGSTNPADLVLFAQYNGGGFTEQWKFGHDLFNNVALFSPGAVTFGTSSGGSGVALMSGSNYITWNGSNFYPGADNTNSNGQSGNRWSNVYTTNINSGSAATNTTALTITTNVADGASSNAMIINNTTSLSTTGAKLLRLQNSGSDKFTVDFSGNMDFPGSGNYLHGSSNQMVYNATIAGNVNHLFFSPALSSSGHIAEFTDNSGGNLFIGTYSGAAHIYAYSETLTCTGTVAAGQVVVWSGSQNVSAAAATNNLTTIAGVAVTGGTNTTITVARMGRVFVKADAGITAGQLVGTSNAAAGNIQSGTPPGAGAILGRAVESTGATISGQVLIDLDKG